MREKESVVTGKNQVIEALKSGQTVNKVFLLRDGRGLNEIHKIARENKVPIQYVSKKKLDSIDGGGKHQGAAVILAARSYIDFEDLLANCKKVEKPLLLILDELEDPQNLGAIMRSAEAAGCQSIIIPERRSVSLNNTVARTSAGAIEYIPVCRVKNLADTIENLKKEGFWVVGCDMSGKEQIYDVDLNIPIALVIGGEGKGIRRLVQEKCDYLVRIPMEGRLNSLNASAAASVVLFEALRQRK